MKAEDFKILLVDDEKDILEFVSYNLKKEGYHILTAENVAQALKLCSKHRPELVLLDVMLPDMDGIEACEEIRKIEGMQRSIIAFLTARAEDYSQIAGFEAGGDDYITKPIRPKVLISRIKALLKRYSSEPVEVADHGRVIEIGEIKIDRDRYIASKSGVELIMPRKEFELLAFLASNPGRVYNRDEIFDAIWGENVIVGNRTIDVHIRKLREKIGEEYIKTVKGVGYKFS